MHCNVISIHKDTGPNGINIWKNVWQCSTDSPPVESDGGSSTAGLHWDEACMVTEVSKYEIHFPLNLMSYLQVINTSAKSFFFYLALHYRIPENDRVHQHGGKSYLPTHRSITC